MQPRSVLVVGETPSLGRSIVDLLEAAELPATFVADVEADGPLPSIGHRHSVVIAAASGYFCTTARRYFRGELPRVALVVVGSRDPLVGRLPAARRFNLPLVPGQLLEGVRSLMARPEESAAALARWLT
ncbi:MAG TPA: hypothetical protein VMG99_03930 [Thermoplasmata archaeon]|nr:hypothetical protein [Thermoplasmata archaeon]